MLLVWFLVLFIGFVLTLFFIPRKEYVPTPQEIHRAIKIRHAMEIVEEKDTKRFYEDIRSLYPL
jgi:cytochrome b subunit of formate dehydrogenase